MKAVAMLVGLGASLGSGWLLFDRSGILLGPVPAWLVAHVLACIAVTYGASGLTGLFGGVRLGAAWWLAALCAPVPVLGPVGVVIMVAVLDFVPPSERRKIRVVVGIPGPVVPPPTLNNAIGRSIVATLASSDTDSRREAVLALRSEYDRSTVMILQKAVRDSDEHVRASAQAQLQKLVETAEERIHRLTELLKRDPANPAARLAIAETTHEMVYSGLAGEEREALMLRRTLEILDGISAGSACWVAARVLALRSHLELRHPRRAQACLDDIERAGFDHESLEGFRLEVLYQKRDWVGLRRAIATFDRDSPARVLRRAVDFWAPRAS